jgi:phosphotriesterase-related protein
VSSAGLNSERFPGFFPRERIVQNGIAALTKFYSLGGRTIVDCTTMDLGRDIGIMQEVSRGSGVNVIATTGCWLDVPRSWQHQDPDRIAQLYVHEATVGIDGTDVKAGIIKCAHESGSVTWERGNGFTKAGKVTVRAAARAAVATGLPITTHTEVEEEVGLAQLEVFEQEGVDLNRVYIGHCNDRCAL